VSISISSKKKDKDRDKDTKGASGIKASTDYTIGKAGEEVGITNTVRSSEVHSETADKAAIEDVTSKIEEDVTSKVEEEMISSSSPSYDNPPTEQTVATTSPSFDHHRYEQNYQQQQREEQQSEISRTLEETRDNIKKSTDEARKDIPRFTQAASEYQEQTIEAAREIADTLLESQKQILGSFQSAWLPHIDTANIFVSNWMSPGHYSQIYANMVSNFADNMIVCTRIANSMMFANMETSKTLMLQARDNTKELSRANVNAARSLEQTSRDAARNVRQNNTSTSYTREYTANEPMSPAKIKEHEPTAVRRQDNTSSSSLSSGQDPKERLRRSGMTEEIAGSTETGDDYEQGAAGTNK
jgi:hypothetical protein